MKGIDLGWIASCQAEKVLESFGISGFVRDHSSIVPGVGPPPDTSLGGVAAAAVKTSHVRRSRFWLAFAVRSPTVVREAADNEACQSATLLVAVEEVTHGDYTLTRAVG